MPSPTNGTGQPIDGSQDPKPWVPTIHEMRNLAQRIVVLLIDAQLTIDLAARRDDDQASQVVYLRAVERHLTSMLTIAHELQESLQLMTDGITVQPPKRG